MNNEEFGALLEQAKIHEIRHLDFKSAFGWRSSARSYKLQVTRAILAMANLSDISYIVIGVNEDRQNRPIFAGLTETQLSEWNMEEVQRFVSDFGDPPPRFVMDQVEYEQKQFLVLSVEEFESIPVIASRTGDDSNSRNIIRSGTVYVRKYGAAESVGVPSQTEMRELIDLGIRKGIAEFLSVISDAGGQIVPATLPTEETSVRRFDSEVEDLL